MGKSRKAEMIWHQYNDDNDMPVEFVSVIIYTDSTGIFSGYRVGGDWIPFNFVIGKTPIQDGDWWMEFPEFREKS